MPKLLRYFVSYSAMATTASSNEGIPILGNIDCMYPKPIRKYEQINDIQNKVKEMLQSTSPDVTIHNVVVDNYILLEDPRNIWDKFIDSLKK